VQCDAQLVRVVGVVGARPEELERSQHRLVERLGLVKKAF
jgi:hypothetical protein